MKNNKRSQERHKIEKQKKKGGRTKQPPFIMYVYALSDASPARRQP